MLKISLSTPCPKLEIPVLATASPLFKGVIKGGFNSNSNLLGCAFLHFTKGGAVCKALQMPTHLPRIANSGQWVYLSGYPGHLPFMFSFSLI